jgi:hypothetical protein
VVSNQISFEFNINNTNKNFGSMNLLRDYKILSDIEGKLRIYINKKVFFEDDYILLMEFGVLLLSWIKHLKLNIVEDFSYNSMDYDDGSILEFISTNDNMWRIYSDWQNFEFSEKLKTNDLISEIEKFLKELKKQLKDTYGINFGKYV